MSTNAPTLSSGSVFDSKKSLMTFTHSFCKMTNNDFVVGKQDKRKIRLKCPDKSCSFFVYAKVNDQYVWEITTLHTGHSCQNAKRKRQRGMDETSHIAKVFVKPKKGSGGRQLQEMMHQEGQKVSYRQAF